MIALKAAHCTGFFKELDSSVHSTFKKLTDLPVWQPQLASLMDHSPLQITGVRFRTSRLDRKQHGPVVRLGFQNKHTPSPELHAHVLSFRMRICEHCCTNESLLCTMLLQVWFSPVFAVYCKGTEICYICCITAMLRPSVLGWCYVDVSIPLIL